MRRPGTDALFFISLVPSAMVVIGLILLFIIVVFERSRESIDVYGFRLFTSSTWSPEQEIYGILSPTVGTFVVSLISTSIAVMFSVPLSVFIVEYLKGFLRDLFSSFVELMGGMPTVIYAVWALRYLVPVMREVVLEPLYNYLGFIPLFSCKPLTGFSILTAGLAIGISIMPFTTSIIMESYKLIPSIYREACLGIGATRYELVKSMLSISKPAILAAAILGFARASGETTIAATLVGNAFTTQICLTGPGYTVPALIASQYENANLYRHAESVLYLAASVVLVSALIASFLGLRILEKWRSRIVV